MTRCGIYTHRTFNVHNQNWVVAEYLLLQKVDVVAVVVVVVDGIVVAVLVLALQIDHFFASNLEQPPSTSPQRESQIQRQGLQSSPNATRH